MTDTVRPAEDGESLYVHQGGIYSPTSQISINNFLESILKRNPRADAEALRKALEYSISAHSAQVRKSGVPYAEHPLEVTKLLAEYQMDTPTLIAGLLHDVVEDTNTNLEEIQTLFGAEVAFMVDAVTKISMLQAESKEQQTAETYRKMLSSMAEDPRVLMIKIADRLHNMRTLSWMPTLSKRKLIAQETLDVYAPLAHRFGLAKVKAEMEDIAFQTLYPDEYSRVMKEILQYRTDRESYIDKMTDMAVVALAGHGLEVQVQGRPKHIYSIWQKQKRRSCRLEQIYDIFAIRVIVKEKIDCYRALGAIHASWLPLQSRFKDYIAVPKPNLYQSLHTTVVGPDERMVEFQIRTREMDLVAERGFAAHWSYKEDNSTPAGEIEWLRQLVRVQEEISDSKEFMEFLKINLAPRELVAFTPAGDTISLPHGATVLDFAYAVHTELGHQCIGARIDGIFVGPERKVPYSSTVTVFRSPHQTPNREWLTWVKTHKAATSIRKWFRDEMRNKMIDLGKAIFARESKLLGASKKPPEIEELIKHFPQVQDADGFYEAIGSGDISLKSLHKALKIPDDLALTGDIELSVEMGSNPLLQFSRCCSPIPGDEIIGLLVPGEGVAIHRSDCTEARRQLQSGQYERIPVKWSDSKREKFTVTLGVSAFDREGLLAELIDTFTLYRAQILRVSTAIIKDGELRGRFQIRINGMAQLQALRQKLMEIPGIQKVERRLYRGKGAERREDKPSSATQQEK